MSLGFIHSRYDHMRESVVTDTDGEAYPDPLTIDYTSITTGLTLIPDAITYTWPDLKKLWIAYYKKTNMLEYDDVVYSANGIEHVGILEPNDSLYLFEVAGLQQYDFTDLQHADSDV